MKPVSFFEKLRSRQELTDWIRNHDPNHKDTWIQENLPKEQVFQARILDALKAWKAAGNIDRNAMIWKQGAAPYQRQGLPDITAIIGGRFFGFEVKRPYGVGRLTGIQAKTIEDINAAGGVAEEVSFADDVKEILIREGAWNNSGEEA